MAMVFGNSLNLSARRMTGLRSTSRCGALALDASGGSLRTDHSDWLLPARGLFGGALSRDFLRRLLGGFPGRRFLLRGLLCGGLLFGGALLRHVGAVRAFVGLDVLERAV